MFLSLTNIKKSFGQGDSRVEVLKGIDLSIEKGEFCVLLGPSGSGKSTLLNIIGGIDGADAGSITIQGERLEDTKLCVKEIFVDGGRMLKRIQPAPQGRAHRIRKRSNHVTIVVDKMVTVENK